MNLLDENFPADQAALLREWRIPHRQIGRDIADYGIHDTNIIPLLHRLKKATLFTQDKDFFKQNLCHSVIRLIVWRGLMENRAKPHFTCADSYDTVSSLLRPRGWASLLG